MRLIIHIEELPDGTLRAQLLNRPGVEAAARDRKSAIVAIQAAALRALAGDIALSGKPIGGLTFIEG